jgi:hypothetical protein
MNDNMKTIEDYIVRKLEEAENAKVELMSRINELEAKNKILEKGRIALAEWLSPSYKKDNFGACICLNHAIKYVDEPITEHPIVQFFGDLMIDEDNEESKDE